MTYELVERIPYPGRNTFFCGGIYKDEEENEWIVKFISEDFFKCGYYNGFRNIKCQNWGMAKDRVVGAIIVDVVGKREFHISKKNMDTFGKLRDISEGNGIFDTTEYYAPTGLWEPKKYDPTDFKEPICV